MDSVKGQTVKRTIAYAYRKMQNAKAEVVECKEKTDKAIQEVKAKKAESEQAIAKAREEEQKARNIAERHGCKYLDNDSLYKFIKQKSPIQAYDLRDAQVKKEKARWAEYDAKSAEKYAELLEGIAQRHFEFEQLKMEVKIAQMQAFLNMPVV